MKRARQLRLVGLGLALMGLGCAERAETRIEKVVDQAIREFQPEWLPSKGQMQGLVVLIVPLARQAGRFDDADRMALLTAGYYYHMVRVADGIPAIYRIDADLLPGIDTLDHAELARMASAAKCDLCILIEPPKKAPKKGSEAFFSPVIRPASLESSSALFAETVARTLEGSIGSAEPVRGLAASAIRISLPEMRPAQSRFGPPPHRLMAEATHKAVAAFAVAQRESLIASRTTRWPQTAPSAVDLGAVRPPRPESDRIATIVRNIRPSGRLSPDEAAWFCSMFRRTSLTDITAVYFDPQPSVDEGGVVLNGATTVPALARTLETALRRAGIEKVANHMRSLPEDGDLGGRRFAIVNISTVRTYSSPSDLGNVQTQLLYGELLWLLDSRDGWFLAQAGDGYWGWVRAEAIRVIDQRQFESSLNSRQAAVLRAIEAGDTRIPAGARLPLAGNSPFGRSLRLPSGDVLTVPAESVRVINDLAMTRPRILPALQMLYIPYVFGARSPLGLDCSGMVNNLFDRGGLPIARDATQQFVSGKLTATRWHRETIRPGDRIYFIDNYGKIFHTGIAITPAHFIHSSPPAVQISSLRKGDRLYEENWDRAFVAAKRP